MKEKTKVIKSEEVEARIEEVDTNCCGCGCGEMCKGCKRKNEKEE